MNAKTWHKRPPRPPCGTQPADTAPAVETDARESPAAGARDPDAEIIWSRGAGARRAGRAFLAQSYDDTVQA
jgi:hypothetical protein